MDRNLKPRGMPADATGHTRSFRIHLCSLGRRLLRSDGSLQSRSPPPPCRHIWSPFFLEVVVEQHHFHTVKSSTHPFLTILTSHKVRGTSLPNRSTSFPEIGRRYVVTRALPCVVRFSKLPDSPPFPGKRGGLV